MQNKKRINVTIDKSVYNLLKQKKTKISTYINQMLRIAINTNPADYIQSTNSINCFKPPKLGIAGSNPARPARKSKAFKGLDLLFF